MAKTTAATSASTTATSSEEVTTHVNNVEMLAAQVFDEVIAPAIAAREWSIVRIRVGLLKRLAIQSVKSQFVALRSTSNIGLARVADVLFSCVTNEHFA